MHQNDRLPVVRGKNYGVNHAMKAKRAIYHRPLTVITQPAELEPLRVAIYTYNRMKKDFMGRKYSIRR